MLTRKLALAYVATNDRAIAEKALALFKKLIGTDLTSILDPVLLDEYAKVLAGNGDGDGVIETYRHLIHVDPTRNDIRINLGVTLIMDGKLAESRRWIDESIDRQPNSFAAWNARGLWFEQSGDFPEAIRATEKSLMLVPTDNPRRRIIERRLQRRLVRCLTKIDCFATAISSVVWCRLRSQNFVEQRIGQVAAPSVPTLEAIEVKHLGDVQCLVDTSQPLSKQLVPNGHNQTVL